MRKEEKKDLFTVEDEKSKEVAAVKQAKRSYPNFNLNFPHQKEL